MKVSGYSPGSMYKRFYGTNMSRMNKSAVATVTDTANSVGSVVFGANLTFSQGISEIAAKQYAARITAEAKEKMASASGISNLLSSLGATSSS